MLTTNLKQLSAAGWLLAAASLSSAFLVPMYLCAWMLDAIAGSKLREWQDSIIYLLSVPALSAAVVTFWAGARALRLLGIDLQKHYTLGAQHDAVADERSRAGDRG